MSRPTPDSSLLQQRFDATGEVIRQRLCVHTGKPPQDCAAHNGRCTTGLYQRMVGTTIVPEPLLGTLKLCGAIYAHPAHTFVFAEQPHHCPGSS